MPFSRHLQQSCPHKTHSRKDKLDPSICQVQVEQGFFLSFQTLLNCVFLCPPAEVLAAAEINFSAWLHDFCAKHRHHIREVWETTKDRVKANSSGLRTCSFLLLFNIKDRSNRMCETSLPSPAPLEQKKIYKSQEQSNS